MVNGGIGNPGSLNFALLHEEFAPNIGFTVFCFGNYRIGTGSMCGMYQNFLTNGRKTSPGYEFCYIIFNDGPLCHSRFYCLQVVEGK